MASDSRDIVRSLVDSDLVQVDLDGPGHPRALMRVEQLAELWLALKNLQAPVPLQERPQNVGGAVLFDEGQDIEPGERRVTQVACHEWIRAHAGTWFTFYDVAMGVLQTSREAVEAYVDHSGDKGRSRHVSLNKMIRQAIEALPGDWKYDEYRTSGTSPLVRCVVRAGQDFPPRPGLNGEVAT